MVQAQHSAARTLAAHGGIEASLADALRAVPVRPMLLDACIAHLAHTGVRHDYDGPALRGFMHLRRALLGNTLSADLKSHSELDMLWREGVAAGHYAACMAEQLGFDTRIAAAAGLMHRVGETVVLAAVATVEARHGLRLDAPSRAGVCAEHGAQQAARLLAAWRFSAPVAVAVMSWRAAATRRAQHTDATAVYVGHLLSTRLQDPEFAALGLDEAITDTLGIARTALDKVLADDQTPRTLLDRVG